MRQPRILPSIGDKFNLWQVIGSPIPHPNGRTNLQSRIECLCLNCGEVKTKRISNLIYDDSKFCYDCTKKERKQRQQQEALQFPIGYRQGDWKVVCIIPHPISSQYRYECLCHTCKQVFVRSKSAVLAGGRCRSCSKRGKKLPKNNPLCPACGVAGKLIGRSRHRKTGEDKYAYLLCPECNFRWSEVGVPRKIAYQERKKKRK